MLIWTRYGFLVPIIGIGGLVIIQLVVNVIYGEGYYTTHANLYAPIGFIFAALLNFVVARAINSNERPEQHIVPITPQPKTSQPQSTFFFIPMQYWSIVMVLAAILAATT